MSSASESGGSSTDEETLFAQFRAFRKMERAEKKKKKKNSNKSSKEQRANVPKVDETNRSTCSELPNCTVSLGESYFMERDQSPTVGRLSDPVDPPREHSTSPVKRTKAVEPTDQKFSSRVCGRSRLRKPLHPRGHATWLCTRSSFSLTITITATQSYSSSTNPTFHNPDPAASWTTIQAPPESPAVTNRPPSPGV
ncbi:hypothetical protein BN14_10164 [Rhizoctonia solani AG-1 IB]|uniref:Uncharacterized protein n=1 Tax=Thanatephorus cucumeris (strain AG1-IB / isolate 7/3/14) TaxID=1108050 RepID=M5CGF8_THACB|nr:hypothetical protein BN14_10164 [Rhizoctonia solani AG-1 IB]